VASAFITQVQPQLQRDPGEETAALLRVLIHKIDNTTFGGDVPALPQWTGPTRMVVQVQQILYASLAASLLSAFLAMLGKQWLNRYASIDMRGSAIERSQDRQRKLDGIIRWYFEHVLECLPLMLQVALLLLGCALSRYLWEINTAVACVVVGVTSFGMLFYLFIIAAGVTSDGCPYQTPWANIIRHLLHLLHLFTKYSLPHRRPNPMHDLLRYPFIRTPLVPEQALDHQATALDFRCISWILRTSLDKAINLLTLDFLRTILAAPGFDNNIVADCFNVFSNCFVTNNRGRVSITGGSERLADISALCFFRAFSSLLITTPTSSAIEDVHQRYKRAFPYRVELQYSSYPVHVIAVHRLFRANMFHDMFNPGGFDHALCKVQLPDLSWTCYNPPFDELVPFAHALAQVARFEYQSKNHRNRKVPRWLLRFALRFLSQDPLPPTSVVVDCLTIIATDLGCNVRGISSMPSDEKYVHTPETIVSLLTLHQHTA